MEKLEWSALEYEEKERSSDWFWALGVIVVSGALASLIYSNYFFAVLLVLSGGLLWFFANKKPDTILYELNEKGLKIGSRIYLYENIKSFWVQKETKEGVKLKPILFVKSDRPFMPILSISIDENRGDVIRNLMLAKKIPEEEMEEHATEKIMDYLGF